MKFNQMWEIIRQNRRRSFVFATLMAMLMMTVGYAAFEFNGPGGGMVGLVGAILLWGLLMITSVLWGDSIMLSIAGAKKIVKKDHPRLFNVVEEMAIASGLGRVPAIYIIDNPSPNAFATGRKPEKSAVAITTGLLEMLNRDELQGVMGHEVAHVINRDILFMTIVSMMLGTILLIRDAFFRSRFRSRYSSKKGKGGGHPAILVILLVILILSPILAQLIYFAISRKREYLADACSVQFTRNPIGLADALKKIGAPQNQSHQKLSGDSLMRAFYISNPAAKSLNELTSTHPPMGKRIAILEKMAGLGYREYEAAYRRVTGKTGQLLPKSAMGIVGAVEYGQENHKNDTPLKRHREVNKARMLINGYKEIACDCGTTVRLPKAYYNEVVKCPHCGHGLNGAA